MTLWVMLAEQWMKFMMGFHLVEPYSRVTSSHEALGLNSIYPFEG